MSELEIIDAHVHFYRSLPLERQNVVNPGRRDRDRWANPESINGYLDFMGISKIVCLPNFPTPQMRKSMLAALPPSVEGTERKAAEAGVERELAQKLSRQNEWLCQEAANNRRLVPAIAIQMVYSPEEMVAELRLRAGQGGKAVKLIPGYYREHPADRAFWPMYEACQELGITVISDSGTLGADDAGFCYGQPANFQDVLEAFPRLTLVMAHFGSAFWDERVELALRFRNLNFDISGGFGAPNFEARDGLRAAALEDAVRLLRKVGVERFMFGTDGPRFSVPAQLEQALGLDLTDSEKHLLMAENAKRIYRIDGAGR
jgi:predicted TIM-barrel fold metal-dependent hydrolase